VSSSLGREAVSAAPAADVELLFQPLVVDGYRLRNRIVMPPMVVNRSILAPEGIAWYAARASGGVALVIVEATSVTGFAVRFGGGKLVPLAEGIHGGGALAAIQLFPGIRGQRVRPADLDSEQIELLIQAYATAAAACAAAGLDGVEIHGAHGYLLNQFFSPVENRRMDAYGATLGGRMLLAVQIARAVRSALGEGRLVLYRHTPVGPGYGVEESLALADALVEAGVDILDISPSSSVLPGDLAAPFRALAVPVIAVGELDRPERAVEVIREGRGDLVAIGRGLIADPQWPMHVQSNRSPIRCTRCSRCQLDLQRGVPVSCPRWSVHEH